MGDFSRYFQILEIPESASSQEIKKAFRDLAQVWHPDKFEHNPRLRAKADEKFKEVNNAYSILIEECRRGTIGNSPAKQSRTSESADNRTASERTQSAGKAESKTQPQPEAKRETPPEELPKEKNSGCASVLVVFIIVLLAFSIASRSPKTEPSDSSANALSAPPNVWTAAQTRQAKRAEIERRIVMKDAEFERLDGWYKRGVLASEQQSYKQALARARKEEQEIEKLIQEYNHTN